MQYSHSENNSGHAALDTFAGIEFTELTNRSEELSPFGAGRQAVLVR